VLSGLIDVYLSLGAAVIGACGIQYCYYLQFLDQVMTTLSHFLNCLSNLVHLMVHLLEGFEFHQIIVKLQKHIVSRGFLINVAAFGYCVYWIGSVEICCSIVLGLNTLEKSRRYYYFDLLHFKALQFRDKYYFINLNF